MSTSAINTREAMARAGFAYLGATIVCAAFGAVYETFSHGVYSYFMLYAFAFPLCGGVLPCFLLAHTHMSLPDKTARNLYHAGIATWTVGSVIQGVLDIYGTTNRLTKVYGYVGILLLAWGIIRWLRRSFRPTMLT